jgi:AcrR family transcriptional regulator
MLPLSNTAGSLLREAALLLAAEKNITQINVSELCRAAGVTRETFYQYAKSPSAFLATVMDDELEPFTALSERLPDHADASTTVMDTPIHELLGHVRRHEAVYRSAANPRLNADLRDVLIERVERLLREYVHRYPHVMPLLNGTPFSENELDAVIAFAASGVVGAIEVALQTGILHDTDRMTSLILATSAPWWFGRDHSR